MLFATRGWGDGAGRTGAGTNGSPAFRMVRACLEGGGASIDVNRDDAARVAEFESALVTPADGLALPFAAGNWDREATPDGGAMVPRAAFLSGLLVPAAP